MPKVRRPKIFCLRARDEAGGNQDPATRVDSYNVKLGGEQCLCG